LEEYCIYIFTRILNSKDKATMNIYAMNTECLLTDLNYNLFNKENIKT